MSYPDPATIANLNRLTTSERAILAAFLIESLESEIDDDAEDAWESEIARRMAELRTGRTKTVPKGIALELMLAEKDEPETS